MEVGNNIVCRRTNKRKLPEICAGDSCSRFPLNELNQDLLERVLSWLPTSSFLRLTSVCKRWKSAAASAPFRRACAKVPRRDPWFFMVDSQPHLITRQQQPIIFDSTESSWKKLNHPPPLLPPSDFIPVASSGGLICFHRADGGCAFIITNPVTASCRQLPPPSPSPQPPPIRAIAMSSKAETFELFVVSGDLPNLVFRRYDSGTDKWGEEIPLARKIDGRIESAARDGDDCTQYYFLSKCGDVVVSTGTQRCPSKQYSSLLTLENNGDETLYFISSSGTVIACNLTRRLFFEYPRLLPVFSEYSIDLVECEGQMYVVLLCEFLESASLRVWKWDESVRFWRQVAAMPPRMSQRFYGKKLDINCTGAGRKMFVCVSSGEVCSYVMCDLVANEWVEIPQNGDAKEFVCAFSFEPRIEASTLGSKTSDSTLGEACS